MDLIIRKLRIRNLKAHVELLRLQGLSLAREFNGVNTNQQKAQIAREWERTTWARHSARIKADRLERQDPSSSPTISTT